MADGDDGMYVLEFTLGAVNPNLGSAYFNGNAQRIRVTDAAPVNPEADPSAYVITGHDITVEAWIYPIGLPPQNDGDIIVSRPYWNAEPWQAYELRIANWGDTDAPRLEFIVSDGNVPGNWGCARASDPIPLGTWMHLAGTYDGTMVRLYINGNLAAETPYTANIGSGNTGFYIGGLGWQYYRGLIDEVRLWNAARSQAEIQATMNTTLKGNEEGLAGYWPLDESTTVNGNFPVTVDMTANHNDLWVQNGVEFVDVTPGSDFSVAPQFVIQSLEGAVGEAFTYQPTAYGWPIPEISFVSGPSGMSFDAGTGTVNWTPDTGQDGYHDFTLQATNTEGTVQGTYPIWVDAYPLAMREHNNNNTALSVFNNGIVGAKEGADPEEGDVGFQFNGADGLFEGDLVIARSESQVSGGLFIREFGTQSSVSSIPSYLPGFDQVFGSRFDDQRAPNPIGVSVTQKSNSKSTSPDEDYVILDYEIANTSGSNLTGIYVGLAMDWDIGVPGNNLGGYDADRKLSYMYESEGGTNSNYYGVSILIGNVSGHTIWQASSGEGNDDVLYGRMTNFNEIPTEPGDQRAILSIGPYDISTGGSVRCVFAVLGGTDLVDLQANADAAASVILPSPNTGSAYFNGINQRVNSSDASPVNPSADPSAYVITGNTITVESWIYPIGLPPQNDGDIIISRPYWGVEPYQAYELRIANWGEADAPRLEFVVSDGSVPGNWGGARASDPIALGTWIHVAGTYDGSMVRLCINGNLVAETPYTADIGAGNAGFFVGGLNWQYFQGLIDEVRLWNVALSQAEIQARMNTTLTGTETGLAGYWPLDESTTVNGKYPVTVDLTQNHNDLWVQNGVEFVGATPGSDFSAAPQFVVQSLAGVIGQALSYRPSATGWPIPNIMYVSGPNGMSFDTGAGTVNWTPVSGQDGYHNFTLQATNTEGTVQGTYPIWVDAYPLAMREHNNNNTALSVFNNGIVGAKEGADPEEGDVGFQFNGADGLFEGDLVIARSESQVSGGLFIREFGTQSSVSSIPSYLHGFDQVFESHFNDQRAPNPIGVNVVQRSNSKSTSPDDDYVIMDYEITNTSGSNLTGIYVGLAMDWDVGNAGNNLGGYDAGRKLSYVYETDGATNSNYYGTAVLIGDVSGHTIWQASGGEGDDDVLYGRITNFNEIPTTVGDQRSILSVGPYDIPAGGNARAMFAVLGGTDLADLQANTDAAAAVFSWAVDLSIAGDGIQMTRTFGGDPSGTDAYDDGLDVVSPPVPQTYYTYFQIGQFPNYLSGDIRGWVSPYDTDIDWSLKVVNAEGLTTTITWNPEDLPTAGHFTLIGASNYNMRTTNSVSFEGNRTLTIQYRSTVQVTYDFQQQGWYMVSLPVFPADSSVNTLFPTSWGAFTWNTTGGVYDNVTKMEPKVGYWLAIPGATSDEVVGLPLNSYTAHYPDQGWYMIGSVLGSVDFTHPEDTPDGSVLVPAFGWNTGSSTYYQTSTFNEKEAYWIAVMGTCDLTVGGGTGGQPSALAKADWTGFAKSHSATPPNPPNINWETGELVQIPTEFGLSQNYPNPFNLETTIEYQIPKDGRVTLIIYNMMGQEVKRLVDEEKRSGYYRVVWDVRGEAGNHVGTGIYLIQIRSGSYGQTRKLLLVQ